MEFNIILLFLARDNGGGGFAQIIAILMIILFAVISSVKGAKKADQKRNRKIPQRRDVANRSFFYTKEEKKRAAMKEPFVDLGFEIIDDNSKTVKPPIAQSVQPVYSKEAEEFDAQMQAEVEAELHGLDNIKNTSIDASKPFSNLENKHLEPNIDEDIASSENYNFGKSDEEYVKKFGKDYNKLGSSQFSEDERIFSGSISDEQKTDESLSIFDRPKGNPKDLAQAIVLAEIFGKPMSMRRPYIEPNEDEFESTHLI